MTDAHDEPQDAFFGDQAERYATHRLRYPDELFDFLVGELDDPRCAWDCATGNGQAAVSLAERLDEVVATDVNADQLEHAFEHPNVDYRRAPAESVDLDDDGVDMATVAAGVHWFELEAFYEEVRRVVREGGLLAVWAYNSVEVDRAVDTVVDRLSNEIVDDFWAPELEYVDASYRSLPFPFDELETPTCRCTFEGTLDRLIGYMSTWSSMQRYRERHGHSAIDEVRGELEDAWGDPEAERTIEVPLFMRVGRI
jgi:SAM-dependent methyltransferase